MRRVRSIAGDSVNLLLYRELGRCDDAAEETLWRHNPLLAEYGPNLRLPHSRAFGDGLFELRLRGRSGIGRALYCFLVDKHIVVLHAFIKKSQRTPDRELRLARKRMKELPNG